MDADISDILAFVSSPQLSPRTIDLQALTRAWVNERASPELLPHPSELVDRTMERIKRQIQSIEDMTGTMDPQANFTLVILQTELERLRYLLRSFLRARIAKVGLDPLPVPNHEYAKVVLASTDTPDQIDKYPIHTRSLALSNPDFLSRLEQQYLQSHQALLSSHYHASFLSSFPSQLQKLDDTQGGVSMIDHPDQESAVFCRVIKDAGTVEIYADTGSSAVEMTRGDIWLLRWSSVKPAVERGDVELV
nr:dna replication complex gins protein sld5 [Quercus suber]